MNAKKRPPPLLRWLLLAALLLPAAGCKKVRTVEYTPIAPLDVAKHQYQLGLDSLVNLLVEADSALNNPEDSAQIRNLFLRARSQYKRGEAVTEYYNGGLAAKMNGPDLLEWDEDEVGGPPERPEGFQVWEGFLYPGYRREATGAMREQVRRLQARTNYLRRFVGSRIFEDAAYFDALMQETARITTKGISGFDSPVALFSLPEAAEALEGVRRGFTLAYRERLHQADPVEFRQLDSAFNATIRPLRQAGDFDAFDRAGFLTEHMNPLCARLRAAQRVLRIALPTDLRALKPGFTTVFEANVFDPWYFAPEKPADSLREARRELGRLLFFDPVLSGNHKRACASCHQPDEAFTDGLAKSRGFQGREAALRNAPTMLNASLQRNYFYDLSVVYLEDQASKVMRNEREMHALPPEIAKRLLESPGYARLFRKAFSGARDSTEPADLRMRQALAAYIRSLVALNSPFDKSMRGDAFAMSAEAKRGFNLFMGKAKCATCHFPPLFNGTVPPEYVKSEKEVIGITDGPAFIHARLDKDPGRYAIVPLEGNRHSFKTPTLRNSGVTAPYMHNGAFPTLKDVVEFYNAGGGAGLGLDVPNQTLPQDSMHLNAREVADLVLFMHALTDTAGTTGRPDHLPAFPAHPQWNRRTVGGEY